MRTTTRWTVVGVGVAALTAVAIPAGARLHHEWYVAQKEDYFRVAREAIRAGADALPDTGFDLSELFEGEEAEGGGEVGEAGERDRAMLRSLAMEADLGHRTPDFTRRLLEVARQESQKWSALAEGRILEAGVSPLAVATASSPGTRAWTSLGPRWARSEFNGTYYTAADSGRVNVVKQHPLDAKRIYLGTSGGGIWRTADIGSSEPVWTPLTDALGSLAIGAMDISTGPGNRIYAGLGDFIDQKAGLVVWSDDDGATWSAPVSLQAASHPAGGPQPIAQSVRAIRVDPSNPNRVLATTDVGLFIANDGITFSLVDLPNTAAFGLTQESTWSIVYLGTDVGGNSHWLVGGSYACPGAAPPQPGVGSSTGCLSGATPIGGNLGDFWLSADSGATWSSVRAAGGFPATIVGSAATDFGRAAIAGAVPGPDPATTVVYALMSSQNEAASSTVGIVKSTDGGATWTRLTAATTLPVNPTIATGSACPNLNLAHAQAWYDLAIAVDPANPNNALAAGDLCSARTRDGGATWELTSHWLPSSGLGQTANGTGNLPYVHADWHWASLYTVAGVSQAFVGCDGGFFTTRNLFDNVPGTLVDWRFPDYGLTTHLTYSHGTGDPTLGNHQLLWAGFQDNGTRYRIVGDENFIADTHTEVFDQVIGGDGIGGAVATDARGANPVYWASVQGQRRFCLPRSRDCQKATRIEDGVELGNWTSAPNPIGDAEPFFMRYSLLHDDASTVVSASNRNVWRVNVNPQAIVTYTRLTPAGIPTILGVARSARGAGAVAPPYKVLVNGVPKRIIGVALTGGASGLLVDDTTPSFISPASIVNVTFGGTTFTPLNSHFVAVPPRPDLPGIGGADPLKTWIVATTSPALLPAAVGQLFLTIDGGATWQPWHGNGTGFDLPNVPVFSVRWDPTNENVVWVGTELGVYRSTDAGLTWARYGTGLPLARVYDLSISRNGCLVRAAAYGRGLWEVFPCSEPGAAPGNGDSDRDGLVDFFDVASLAIRLGKAPSTPADPFDNMMPRYDANLDLTGNPLLLEEADLGALVAKIGGQP